MVDERESIDFREVDERRCVENPHSQCLEILGEMVVIDPRDIALCGELRKIPDGHACQLSCVSNLYQDIQSLMKVISKCLCGMTS